MASGYTPSETAQLDQLRAFGQTKLDEFVDEYRRQLDSGDDPGLVFEGLWEGSQFAMRGLGPRTAALILASAVERLAGGGS